MANSDRAEAQDPLQNLLKDAFFPEFPGYSRGKVRDNYDLADGRRIMISTDRQSAFDQVLAAVPFKGQVLNETARFWFEATSDIIPNHALSFPDPNVTVAKRLTMLPVEIVVRDYLTGSTATSLLPMYQAGQRKLYGHVLPDGLRANQRLPKTLITPTTKGARGGHDEPITATQIVEHGLLSRSVWENVETAALALFERGRQIADSRGLILVDTKYEFGTDVDGQLILADEVHTPDSSRYWYKASYADRLSSGHYPESLDKEFLRRWIADRCDPYRDPIPDIPRETLMEFSRRYIALYETITGARFMPPPPHPPIRDRVFANLESYLAEERA
ncbi:MAG: phosphoribosylaminoimidazolesuccinocarboxamide synthase [Rhodospirillales bacterium]|nr:phosphoribosylaminoimidazolesuccinocarboxamide synthase [Rhodospirillales bacterium]